ncbi:hypothetical protein [Pseudoalteromonas phage B8b]|uniref:Uncharacterized protein n=1 Tax=Pseudoalteromonas phage B8b TaxID=1506997 RepID=A0A076G801_9CAUD|nr:hypothetical protein [Pseudoalteromonas phage B8b]
MYGGVWWRMVAYIYYRHKKGALVLPGAPYLLKFNLIYDFSV